MLITTRQLALLEEVALASFEEQMVAHCEAFAPRRARALGRARLSGIVRGSIERAAHHGFDARGPVRLFIELGFLFGSGFDADVQYPWAREALARPEAPSPLDPVSEQMDRAAVLHGAALDALDAILGPDDGHLRAAQRRALALAAEPWPEQVDDREAFALAALERVHPEKCAFVGAPALRQLVTAGAREAARYELDAPRDALLLVALMFAYGQGCARDPIHPWIGAALADPAIPTPALRARRLEERALMEARAALADRSSTHA
ncbi:hypothetical protein BE08_27240 [Sorangium cellulosum]|uniref:Uncharacterized protein n=1 Tax=Sorangium cellulosum TaxID=56 RepID=A0A150P1Z1_SORCE|nr:hypothetical protein BE08_27240 [Sorangium cellulosum]